MTDEQSGAATGRDGGGAPASGGGGGAAAGTAGARTVSGAALWIGGAVLVGWAAFVVFLVVRASPDETGEVQWTRLAWIFSSVEAVVFAAAGAIFGSTVQRQRAERAEQRADANEQDAASGRALHSAIVADAEADAEGAAAELAAAAGSGLRTRDAGAAAPRAASPGVAQRHARLARALFPQRS